MSQRSAGLCTRCTRSNAFPDIEDISAASCGHIFQCFSPLVNDVIHKVRTLWEGPKIWKKSCFDIYLASSKHVGDFLKFLWPFKKTLTLKNYVLSYENLAGKLQTAPTIDFKFCWDHYFRDRLMAMYNRYHSRFFVQLGHETTYAPSGNKHFFTKSCHPSSDLPKLLRTSVDPVHKYCLCTGFTDIILVGLVMTCIKLVKKCLFTHMWFHAQLIQKILSGI